MQHGIDANVTHSSGPRPVVADPCDPAGGLELHSGQEPPDDSGPERTCAVTRQKHAPEALIRFVLSPQGEIVPDIRCKLPGRGVWILAHADIVGQALKRGSFARGFKTKVVPPAGLAQQVAALLEKDALQSLSIANKAGVVVTGFAKVEAACASEALAALVHAADGGADGIRKLGQALRRRRDNLPMPVEINIFNSLQLDLALGRTNVIHAAMKDKAASAAFLARARRLAIYRAPAVPETQDAYPPRKPATGGTDQ